jgi:hypothetical protein
MIQIDHKSTIPGQKIRAVRDFLRMYCDRKPDAKSVASFLKTDSLGASVIINALVEAHLLLQVGHSIGIVSRQAAGGNSTTNEQRHEITKDGTCGRGAWESSSLTLVLHA